MRIEPIATVEDGELTASLPGCLSESAAPQDAAGKYLEPGKKYALLFGGAPAGEVQLRESNHKESTASVAYTGTVKIHGQVRALATNPEQTDFRVASREPATAEQRASALTLAREIFGEHGIPEKLLSSVRVEYLTRTYLAPSSLPSLIGSFTLDTSDSDGLLHSLFFIASQPSEKLLPELVWIHLSETETDEEHLRLVDHADLFGNGQDEVVTKLVSLQTQSHRYLIFRRTRDGAHWEQIFKSEPLGCSN
ncbi:MAG TPA: hypothetical protein VKH15_01650 [Candidatus Acidoferrum sp.]|nr:hypothetical protein [Candidatus Acidoferrum sp.]